MLQKTIIQDGQQIKNNTRVQYLLAGHHSAIISRELFDAVQAEKARRSNLKITESSSQRKSTKYNSTNVLSGLLICEECSSPYRRVTRSGGEVVWRCANRVEYGKVYCKDSITVTDTAVKEFLCQTLDMQVFEEQLVRVNVGSILVIHQSSISV